ncbi:MAG: alpha/beta hydrolase [Dehalococcoidia bacterium]|nr:alpha/beta hydrolase [Dehalococcoidia bacterium]
MSNDNITIEEGVAFGRGGGRDLKCDIYSPATRNGTGVLVLYGGGWRMGERSRVRDACLSLARRGFVAVAGEYRLTPESPWPAQIHDVKANIRWIRANAARLGIDPARIAAEGHSAGAHLTLLAAGTPGLPEFEGDGGNAGVSSELAAAVGIYPPTVFQATEQKISGSVPADALMGKAATETLARAAGPLAYASAAFPPTFLLHGSNDRVVPVSASLRMFEALSDARAHVEMHIYPGLPHGFARIPSMQDQVQGEIADFLRRTVAAPDAFRAEMDELAAQMAAMRAPQAVPAG